VTIVLLIVSKVKLDYFTAPTHCLEDFAVIYQKSISRPLILYTDKTHKTKVNNKSNSEKGLMSFL